MYLMNACVSAATPMLCVVVITLFLWSYQLSCCGTVLYPMCYLSMQDTVAEVAEVFAVHLLAVTLVQGTLNSIPPTIGPNNVAMVTITSNDSPEGIITFTQDSYTVQEGVSYINITIARQQGTVGVVSVIYFSSNGLALNGEDYIVDPVNEISFSNGQSEVTLSVRIEDDDIPEVDEDFCLGLRLPRNGAVIGNISQSESS